MIWKIWILVPAAYGIFLLWYYNWNGPLQPDEISDLVEAFNRAEGNQHTDAEVFRKFLEGDDGREFVMLNLIQLHEGTIAHPVSGKKMSASSLIGEYFGPFSLALLKRGGHPVFQARTVGGNIDSWNADDNVGFGTTAMMRYRSRRDLVELVLDPAFADGHVFKLAAIERTISYPTQIAMSTSLGPPVTVLLLLLLLASLAQNIVFFRKRGSSK
jgi:hypothetical protein